MALLDEDLRQMLLLRWQLCEPEELQSAELPYNAAWARAALLHQVLVDFHDESRAGRVAGIATEAEIAGLRELVGSARAHVDAMARQMTTGH